MLAMVKSWHVFAYSSVSRSLRMSSYARLRSICTHPRPRAESADAQHSPDGFLITHYPGQGFHESEKESLNDFCGDALRNAYLRVTHNQS